MMVTWHSGGHLVVNFVTCWNWWHMSDAVIVNNNVKSWSTLCDAGKKEKGRSHTNTVPICLLSSPRLVLQAVANPPWCIHLLNCVVTRLWSSQSTVPWTRQTLWVDSCRSELRITRQPISSQLQHGHTLHTYVPVAPHTHCGACVVYFNMTLGSLDTTVQ